jgi:hypothetical protein
MEAGEMAPNFKAILMVSANCPEELRACDLDRVIDQADQAGFKFEFIGWLKVQNLPDRTKKRLMEEFAP